MEKVFIALQELKELIKKNTATNKQFLPLAEAADYLGISKSTLYKHTSSGGITFYRPKGKLILFKKDELIAWIEKNKIVGEERKGGLSC